LGKEPWTLFDRISSTTYVSNIHKYYVTYLLIQGEYIQRRDLKRRGAGG
jgi:hypothetical protein